MARTQTQTQTPQQAAPAQANALTLPPQQRNQLAMIKAGIEHRMPLIRHLLPKGYGEEKFLSSVLTALANSKDGKLFECEPMSILKAAVEAAELGLSLNPHRKECDIIPRWNGKANRLEAQLQPRYGGLMTLAKRSGEVRSISSTAVREGDEFRYERGLTPILVHKPKLNNRGKLIAAYCVWVLADGTREFEVVEQEDIDRAKKASQSKDKEGNFYGPWKDDEEEQWRKTAIRRAAKYMPSSADDFQKAVQMDTMRDIGQDVELHDGEIVDITEPVAPQPADAPRQQAKQLDDLEQKVAAKPGPSKSGMSTIAPQKNGDDIDYESWCAIVVPIIQKLDAAGKAEWRARHTVFLEAAEFTAPDRVEPVVKALAS